MSIAFRIVGVGANKPAELLRKDRGTGQKVYTEEMRDTVPTGLPFINDTFGVSMNQDAAFGGTPIPVHDGTDTTLWTGTEIVGGKVTFDSTDRPHTGTKSVEIDNPNTLDTWQFSKGSDQDLTNYTALTFFVNVDKDWDSGDSVTMFGWDTGTGSIVGNTVPIEDYFNETTFDVWQSVAIPLADLGLTGETIDAFRMQQATKNGKAGKFYLDDFQIEESGGGAVFTASANAGTTFEVKTIVYQWVGVGTGGAAYAYNKMGQLAALTNGIVIRAQKGGEAIFTSTLRQLSDFTFTGANIISVVDDGTNTMVTLNIDNLFGQGLVIDSQFDDSFSITISDDLSGLLEFRALLQGNEEIL